MSSSTFRRRASKPSRTTSPCQRHIAVVGRPDRPSPDINSKIVQINFNPFWTVPVSIVRKDLIPLMQDKPDYLTQNHIRIYDPHHKEVPPSQINWYSDDAVHYTFRRGSRRPNSLGRIRINFPSQYGVYMHDTPLKNLFGGDFRYDSSGCCRVQNVQELVVWLLDGHQRVGARPHRSGGQIRRSGQCQSDQAGAAALGLCHRLVGVRRHRAIPRGYLRPRRARRAGHSADGEALRRDGKTAQTRLGNETPNHAGCFRLLDVFRQIRRRPWRCFATAMPTRLTP